MICLDKLHKSNVLIKGRQKTYIGTSLVVQWLRLCASNAGGMALIPGQGTKILYMPHGMAKNIYTYKCIYIHTHICTFWVGNCDQSITKTSTFSRVQ